MSPKADIKKSSGPRTLHLTLTRKWFDMIASGIKKEEYRAMKPYWNYRFAMNKYDRIKFRNGYLPTSPTLVVELKEIWSGFGIVEWGAPMGERVYILRIGKILEAKI